MKKNAIGYLIFGVLLGFGIGFLWTNSMNRAYIKDVEEKAKKEAFEKANPTAANSGADPHGDELDDKIPEVIEISKRNRSDLDLQLKAGKFLYGKQKFDEAKACFDAALKLDAKNHEALVMLGNVNFDTGNFPEASNWYEKALAVKPDDISVRTDLGISYHRRQPPQLDKAIENYRISLKMDGNHLQTLFNLTKALIEKKEFQEARTYVDKLVQIAPNDKDVAQLKAAFEGSAGDTKREIPTH